MQFLGHARGSNCEVQTQLVIARSLQYGKPSFLDSAESLSEEVSRMLAAIMSRLKK